MKLKHGIFVKEIMCLFAKKHPSEVTDCKAFQQNTNCIFFYSLFNYFPLYSFESTAWAKSTVNQFFSKGEYYLVEWSFQKVSFDPLENMVSCLVNNTSLVTCNRTTPRDICTRKITVFLFFEMWRIYWDLF